MTAVVSSRRPERVSTVSTVSNPASELDFLSKPENYSRSSVLSIPRVAYLGKDSTSSLRSMKQDKREILPKLDPRLLERYRDYAFDDDSDSSTENIRKKKTIHDTRPKTQPSRKRSNVTSSFRPEHVDLTLQRPLTSSAMTSSPRSDDSRDSGRMTSRAKALLNLTASHHQTKYSSIHSLLNSSQIRLARDRFRHATRIILILLKWISSLSEAGDGDGGDGGGRTFTDIANEAFTSDELKNSGLSFDLSKFKAKREVNVSSEVKTILSIPSHARTSEQIQTALIGLQHMKSFAEYPLHMQEKLCKVAWFQQVPPKRVIIRQGHFAENFYFILSGQAVVRILDKNTKTGEVQLRTAAIMKKGTSFGELALLHHSVRTATVVSQDTVQLLAIGRDDFFDIFMAGSGPDGMPDHIRFVSQLDFMKDWPIQNLLEHPEWCLFHFFKRGVVIVKDSDSSEWLYIVKSGSCQVMKELKGVKANVSSPQKTQRPSQSFTLPKLGTGEITSKIDTGKRPSRKCVTPDLPFEPYINQEKDQMASKHGEGRRKSVELETIQPVMLTVPPPTDNPGYSKSRFTKFLDSRKSQTNTLNMPPIHTPPRSSSASPQMHSPRSKTAKKDTELEVPEELRGPVFVQVEVLKPKDTFGLTSVQFDDDVEVPQTSVSLVSNGAECIMLSKKFFIMHANEKVKKQIRYHVRPYPTEESLQENLQTKVDWDIYKKKLVKGMLAEKARATMLTSGSKT